MAQNSPSPHYTGIDVGTSAVRVVVGTVNADGAPEVIGHSAVANGGMRRGVVSHVEEVAAAIAQAVHNAERLSGRKITHATINVNGAHVNGVDSTGVIAISATNREVSDQDRLRVEEAAAVMQMPANREIIQVFPKAYRLDGQDNIKDPVGMQGVRLEVDTHIVTASTPNVRLLEQALERSSVTYRHSTVSGLAAAEAVLTRQQREAGTALVDIGAGTTNIVVIEDGEVQHVAVLPVGGIHVTNDLAIGLKTELDIAEAVKVQHASLKPSTRAAATVKHQKKQHTFPADDIHMIVEARIEELLELVEAQLSSIGKAKKLPGGVVITGGSAQITGMAEFAKMRLDLPAKVGMVLDVGGLADQMNPTTYASPIGLMLLDMLLEGQHAQGHPNDDYKGVVGNMTALFRKLKK